MQRLFYELYVKNATFTFLFTHKGREAVKIELINPLCENEAITCTGLDAYDQLTPDDIDGLGLLRNSPYRLRREAMTMLREYMQGASGFLPPHTQYGQMLFGMDLEDWDSI